MAISSHNLTSHLGPHQFEDSESIDRLLAQVSAKIRAQLEQGSVLEPVSEVVMISETGDLIASDLSSTDLSSTALSSAALSESFIELESTSIVESPAPELGGSSPMFAGIDIKQMAAEGYFQAIAYWLNEILVPQNVYAQVLADEVPGRLKVLVEFERSPQPQRLVKFVCDRLYQLNSNVIEGVHLIVRALGAATTHWEKSIRIPTAAERHAKRTHQSQTPLPQIESLAQLKNTQLKNTQFKNKAAQSDRSAQVVHESFSTQLARQAVQGQFKFFRAVLVCGSAIAAFFFGSFTELILSDRLSLTTAQQTEEKILPWYGKDTSADSLPDFSADFSQVTEVSFRPASRFQGRTVEAAFETVAVVTHDHLIDPSDPTVTLVFGGNLSLNNFVFEDSSEVDRLFSDIDIYRNADVAMVGLGEPLAYASTSLQEDFHHRTRPQVTDALKSGGIDIVGLASEGSMTYGTRGLTETLDNLDRHGIYRVGAGRNQKEAHRPEILEVKGQRIAYLGYNPDALKGAQADDAGVALPSSETRQNLIEDIRAIRSQVDWIVVNYRWGDALDTEADTSQADTSQADAPQADTPNTITTSPPADWQTALAHEAVDAGADLVVGYHPTQIQGAEIYRDRPIAYALKDLNFDNATPTDLATQYDTAALKVSLRNQQMKVEFLPVTIHDSKLQLATGDQGENILQTIRRSSAPLKQPMLFPTVIKADPLPLESESSTVSTPTPSTPDIDSDDRENDYRENAIDSDTSENILFNSDESVDFESTDFESIDSEPTGFEPTDFESTDFESIDSEPTDFESTDFESTDFDFVDSDFIDSERAPNAERLPEMPSTEMLPDEMKEPEALFMPKEMPSSSSEITPLELWEDPFNAAESE